MQYRWMMCVALLVGLLSMALGAPDPALPVPGAELVNGGFDAQLDASGRPEGWGQYISKFGTARLSTDTEVKQDGMGSLKMEVDEKSACTVSQYLSASDAGPFTFSCLARTTAPATNGIQVSVEWFRLTDWPRRVQMVGRTSSSAVLYGDDTWQRLGAVAVKPDGADLALVAITVGDAQAPAGTYWVDGADFSPGARPAPLLGNPGFELDLNNDTIPDNWGRSYYGDGFEIVRDTEVKHGGAASVRLTGQAEHGNRSVLSTQSPYFVPPQRIRVSFWYKGSGASDNLVDVLPGEGAVAANGTVYFERHSVTLELPVDDWTQFVQEYEVPQDARDFGRMRVDFLMYQRGEGTLWLDDFRLEVVE